ncbi:MAG: metallophosphoesterase [Clostridia bacterium]|nr:metallophosphoesterase [Clostridia bacterium]
MKKVLSIILSVLVVVLAVVPFFAGAVIHSDAYAVIFTASDLQGGEGAYTNFATLLSIAKNHAYATPPDGILLGGDYTDSQQDVATNVPKVLSTVQSVYPNYSVDKMIFVQGNHDNNPYNPTGGYNFNHYNVFTLNIDEYPRAQGASTANETTVMNTAAKLEAFLEQLKSGGDTRPVFITAHAPMHHSIRGDSNAGDYGDTLYSKHVFDVVNEYGQYLDIIFLFGHNHSSTYDDYIGGAVNYIAKGETMRVPIPDKAQQGVNGYTDETLNFTYMNYGYVGYSNNGTSDGSTNTLTMGAIELCQNTIELTRYSGDGVYTTETIQRVNTTPYIGIDGKTTGIEGNSDIVYGVATNIKATDYSWSSSDDSVVKVLSAGENAQVIYTGEGTADVTLTVTGTDGKKYSKTITITVSGATRTETVVTPGENYVVYELVSTLTSGKEYIIASRNTAGSTRAIGNTVSSRQTVGYAVTVSNADDDSSKIHIKDDGSAVLWTATSSGNYYTFNNGSRYLVGARSGQTRYLNVGTITGNARQWTLSNNMLTNRSYNTYKIAATGNNFTITTSGSAIYFYEKTEYTTESTTEEVTVTDPYNPSVSFIKDAANINGSTLEMYNVNFGETFMIDGSFTGFSNQADKVTTTWTSSNSDVATVENGYVTTVGKGETVITYTVTDGTTTIEQSFTLVLSDEDKPVQMFALTDTLKNGNLYVIANSSVAGAYSVMSSPAIDTGKTDHRIRHTAISTSIESVNGVPSIYASSDAMVWKAIETTGGFYLRNVSQGYYLYANNDDGPNDLGATDDTSTNGTVWTVNSSGNLVSNDSSGDMGIKYSGDDNFRSCPDSDTSSRVSFYGLTKTSGTIDIYSRYQKVQGTTMTRENVCPFQTENLLAKPNRFSVADEFITYEWTSSNPDVATVDNNGVVTYTGNPGTATFTVVATSTVADEAGEYETASASVTINVVAQSIGSVSEDFVLTNKLENGNLYVIASTNVAGSTTLMVPPYTDTYSGDQRYGYRFSGTSSTVVDNDGSYTIATDNNSYVWEAIEADDGSGFYLRNVQDGFYLYANDDSRTNGSTATLELGGTEDKTLNGTIWTADSNGQIISNDNLRIYLSGNGNFRAHASSSKQYLYGKTTGSSEVPAPVTQIRVSSLLGTDDISNQLQNRYNIKANDTERVLRYTENFASITSTKWSVSDESIATIDENGLLTYTGKEGFVSVTLVVTGTDAAGQVVEHTVMTTFNISNDDYEAPTEDYPQYPHEGSVRVNKTASNTAGGYNFQTSGVTEVELSVTGVPLTQAVDVVVVLDHSSSMSNNGVTRLENAIANTRDFAMQVVTSNPNNRIAVVTFDRPRATYGSEGSGVNNFTDTTPDDTTYTANPEDRIVTGDGTAENAFMALEDSEQLIAQIDSISTNNIGGTNYDFGLQEAYRILKAAKSDPNANKMQYVVFMSDGEPYTYNRIRVEYNGNYDGVYDAWLTGDETNATLAGHLADTETYPAAQYFNTDGENWFAVALKTPEGQDVAGLPNVDYYDGFHEGLGATLFTIGYDAGEPGTITRDILTNMASTEDDYYYAEGNLQAAYDSILEKIVYAANNAVVTDKMGENFQLQFAPSLTLDNGMATLTFDPAPYIEIGSWTLNSDGTRNEYTAVETITFETDASGKLTAAYSNLRGSNNIYDSATNKIVGSKVTYDITSETFSWNVGDITRDEVTLKYYAYLEGSAEGEREAGTFDTNEYAYLDYTNYRGTQCHQVFPVPSLAWKDAIVGYEFYLVNGNGEPVNKDGVVVPFAERVLVGQEKTKSLILNSAGDYSALTLVAKEEVPAGYILFNENTSYSVSVSSGDNPSQAIINDDADIKTTYFRDGNVVYKGHGVVPNVTDYMNTRVSFAILRVGGIVPDSVVIDYGLSVKISVLANDINANKGVLNAIGTTLLDGTELNNVPYSESRLQDATKTGLVLPNGTASINGSQVVYTPSNLTMSTENVFYYEYLTDDGLYMYAEITVIPAANIYYEESFFTFNDGDGYTWQTAGTGFDDKFQAEDRPGTFSFADVDANNVYGMDNAYDDSYTYSLGSAKFTSVDENAYGKEPTAEFTFCGTGFDLFSVTNSNTGAVLVTVYDSDGALCENFIVQTYYGYTYDEENDKFVPSTDSTGVLYQVPVISAHNLGYDTYRVVIKPIYSTLFDKAADGSYDIYLDSVRIYNPAGQKPAEDSVIGDAYIEDSEYNPNFKELRNTILDANTFYSDIYELDGTKYGKGSVFIDSIGALDETGISDKFLTAGPNNEVYLAEGQAIAFHLVSDTELSPSSVQLGMKTVFGESSEVALMNTNDLTPRYVTVSGAHEMYRRLASAIVWDETELATTGKYKTKYPIVIINTSDSILSLTQLKWAFAVPTDDAELQVVVDSETPARAYSVAKSVMAPFPYTDEDIKMEWSDTSLKEGAEVTLTITTPADIAKITIDGIEITEFTVDANGNKVWTYTFMVQETGENTYDILLFANNGKVSQPMVTETITVNEDNGAVNPFDAILELIKRILQFFREIFA